MAFLDSYKPRIVAMQQSPWYAATLILLALSSGSVLIYEWWPGTNDHVLLTLLRFDFYVACLFLCDFFLGLYVSHGYPDRLTYFRKNWMNLISAIPVTTELTQLLRLLRIWRAWRIVRMAIGAHALLRFFRPTKH